MTPVPEWVLTVAIKSGVLIFIVVTSFAYLMLTERKMLGWFQLRLGPTWCGPWGLMQPAADAVKFVFKEDLTPGGADRFIYKVAPAIAVLTALLAYAVIPFGYVSGWRARSRSLTQRRHPVHLLAVASVGVYGIALGGWASQSKWSLLGAIRSTAQMISYELAMGLSIVAVLMLAGTTGPAAASSPHNPHTTCGSCIPQFIAFLIYGITATAETNRAPFDLPEAETELVAGFHTEYSSLRFGTFFVAEYVNMITVCVHRERCCFSAGATDRSCPQLPISRRLVLGQSGCLALRRSFGCARRCRACATTASWHSAGRCCCRSRWLNLLVTARASSRCDGT